MRYVLFLDIGWLLVEAGICDDGLDAFAQAFLSEGHVLMLLLRGVVGLQRCVDF